MKTQFARAHSYSVGKVSGVLAEASREPEACPHVANPGPPEWLLGSRAAVEFAVDAYMSTGAKVRCKDGELRERKRRADSRCLVAGVLSHPMPLNELKATGSGMRDKLDALKRAEQVKRWRDESIAWLKQLYGDKLVAVVEHRDESHPHIHFFVVGDAQRLHPGLRNELVNDKRIVDPEARMAAHKAGLSVWLDSYSESVGQRNALDRGDGTSRPAWRIKDRGVRAQLFELQKLIAGVLDDQQRAALEAKYIAVYDEQPLMPRERMRF